MINSTWTLFLDRDGVINARILGGYIKKWEEFEFLPGVNEALKILAGVFPRIIVVSNQQGIGKGLMTKDDLEALHSLMTARVMQSGGRIDRIYYSPFLEKEGSLYRKPNIGMALSARKDFHAINFKRSVMVGDSISDMVFGAKLKMVNVFISDDVNQARKNHRCIHYIYPDLISFAETLNKDKK